MRSRICSRMHRTRMQTHLCIYTDLDASICSEFEKMKRVSGSVRERFCVKFEHYVAWLQTHGMRNLADASDEALQRLVLVDAFVKEAVLQQPGVLFDDELLLECEEASNAIPGTLFRCDMLVDCSCAEPCDWKTAFDTRHDLDRESSKFQYLLALDEERTLAGVPYSVLCTDVVREEISKRQLMCSLEFARCKVVMKHFQKRILVVGVKSFLMEEYGTMITGRNRSNTSAKLTEMLSVH